MEAFKLNAIDINERILLPECLKANKKAPKKKERQFSIFFISLRLGLKLKTLAAKSYF